MRGVDAESGEPMQKTISKDSVVVVATDQVSSDFLDEEIVVLDVHDGSYYVLNPVGARIWSMIQNPRSVIELIAALQEEYEVAADRCAREVIDLLEELAERELIDVRDEAD